MRRLILGLASDEISDPTVSGTSAVGIDAETQTYLDGAEIVHGDAATAVETEHEAVDFDRDYVTRTQEPTTERVATEFFADLDAGFVAVDKGNGEFLFEFLGASNGTVIERAAFDVDRFRRQLQQAEKATCWHVAADTDDAVSMDYHNAASFDADGRAAQVGFEYLWDGRPMKGVVAASGYAALFHDEPPEIVGRWIRDELLPFAIDPESEQSELSDGGDA